MRSALPLPKDKIVANYLVMESYPSGSRGRFAKPLDRRKTVHEFESHTFRINLGVFF